MENVLANAQERMARRYLFEVKGITLEKLISAVAGFTGICSEDIVGTSKVRSVVRARTLCCHWAVRELGLSLTHVAAQLKISVPTVSFAVQKGEALVCDRAWALEDLLNVKM